MSEHDEQAALFQALELEDNPLSRWIFAIPNGGHRHIAVAKKMKDEGVKAGVWDIFVPVAKGGYHGLFIEMKFGDNTLTPKQKEFQQFADQQGYLTFFTNDWYVAYEYIQEYFRL